MMCSTRQSPQQVLYSLYDAIALTELKGYTMIQFSYMLLRLYGKGSLFTCSKFYTINLERLQETSRKKLNRVGKGTRNAPMRLSKQ